MTATEMLPAVGATVMVACVIQDVKMSYGRPRFQVRPIAGAGDQWVELQRISLGECRAANRAELVEWRDSKTGTGDVAGPGFRVGVAADRS